MGNFSISEMYTLELRWEDVLYDEEGICRFVGAYFTGPVLSIAEKILPNDRLMLDFKKQYPIIIKEAYVADFSWKEVVYNNDIVELRDVIMTHGKLNKIPRLKRSDYVVIDTQDHEMATHMFNLLYTSYVVSENHIMYNFMKGK